MNQPVKFSTTIQPWGNSLGLRITRPVGHLARLKKGSKVIVEVVEGGLLVKPQQPAKKPIKLPFTEQQLVKGLTPFKAHADELPSRLDSELGL